MSYIEMRGIYKVYPPDVVALEDIHWELIRGEIHSIVGENGAGKSTLMKILSGLIKPSAGDILVDGKRVSFSAPSQAMKAGIGMVHQEFMLVPSFRVYENVVLGAEGHSLKAGGLLDKNKAKRLVRETAMAYGFQIDVDAITGEVPVATQQKVEILKQLFRDVDVLIMDEPTAVLTPQETHELFERLRTLNRAGKTIVFISHKLDEVLEISDRITVLRKGGKIGTIENKGVTRDRIANMMVGRNVVFTVKKTPSAIGKTVVKLRDLEIIRGGGKKIGPLSFEIHEGEVLGVAGIEGNGQFELVEALIGTIKPEAGKILINGVDITSFSIRKRRDYIAFVSQDRKYTGLALDASIDKNMLMTHHIGNGFRKFSVSVDWNKVRVFSKELVERFSVVCRSIHESIKTLSGGNQQKIVVAREFSLNVSFLLLDQPTRGLDVGTIEFIHRTILKMKERGRAILLISAELDELFTLSDRLMVMKDGKIVAVLNPESTTKEEVGAYMLGVYGDA